jgi:hypothetical protein
MRARTRLAHARELVALCMLAFGALACSGHDEEIDRASSALDDVDAGDASDEQASLLQPSPASANQATAKPNATNVTAPTSPASTRPNDGHAAAQPTVDPQIAGGVDRWATPPARHARNGAKTHGTHA